VASNPDLGSAAVPAVALISTNVAPATVLIPLAAMRQFRGFPAVGLHRVMRVTEHLALRQLGLSTR
jgi:hypothetical protein